MNINSHSESLTTLDALKQAGTGDLTFYNMFSPFTDHSSTQSSSLSSTAHVNVDSAHSRTYFGRDTPLKF